MLGGPFAAFENFVTVKAAPLFPCHRWPLNACLASDHYARMGLCHAQLLWFRQQPVSRFLGEDHARTGREVAGDRQEPAVRVYVPLEAVFFFLPKAALNKRVGHHLGKYRIAIVSNGLHDGVEKRLYFMWACERNFVVHAQSSFTYLAFKKHRSGCIGPYSFHCSHSCRYQP